MMSKVDRVLRGLQKRDLTPRQISSQYGLVNPRDAVYKLRNRGFDIQTEQTKKGAKYSLYA